MPLDPMTYIADFHCHSHFSLATSKLLVPEYLDYWARLKGIRVVGSGDFTHPGWLAELKQKLEPSGDGLFQLKPGLHLPELNRRFSLRETGVRFILSAEISSIYKRMGRVRKVHSLILAPDFETAERIQAAIVRLGGNITSDGRPILGLSARDLLELVLQASERCIFIPAHIWTPWFSILGSRSGFASIKECFDDLTPHIHAVEMGLSSDPPMNWLCSFLTNYRLIANSDAHSPEKLGRNANIFSGTPSYDSLERSLKHPETADFCGTIHLFPQEGKYHYDGHRKCGIRWDPIETVREGGICSHCGKPVTLGVLHRVLELADRDGPGSGKKPGFHSLIPLKEILSEMLGRGSGSRRVGDVYLDLLQKLGPELAILLERTRAELETAGGGLLAEAVIRMRERKVAIREGFDGEFGKISLLTKDELSRQGGKTDMSSFKSVGERRGSLIPARPLIAIDVARFRGLDRTAICGSERQLNLFEFDRS